MYALIDNNAVKQYPYGADILRRDNPQTSFPKNPSVEILASYGVYLVKPTDRPVFDPATHKVEEGIPTLVAGEWVQVWNIVALTAEEQQQYKQALQASIVAETQQRLDDFARTRNYDSILSLCTYATSTVPKFQAEGQYGVEARDATWAKLYEILAEVEAGTRPVPSGYQDIEADLPVLAWPN